MPTTAKVTGCVIKSNDGDISLRVDGATTQVTTLMRDRQEIMPPIALLKDGQLAMEFEPQQGFLFTEKIVVVIP